MKRAKQAEYQAIAARPWRAQETVECGTDWDWARAVSKQRAPGLAAFVVLGLLHPTREISRVPRSGDQRVLFQQEVPRMRTVCRSSRPTLAILPSLREISSQGCDGCGEHDTDSEGYLQLQKRPFTCGERQRMAGAHGMKLQVPAHQQAAPAARATTHLL